ncbi:MAG TPA: SgcJ/EcaC family oxidoreductase [Steroidobacteraceae bacterium]|nr:SgcJ/EcaC family oxidoreductase [Steroidobacteraceae bacterium]
MARLNRMPGIAVIALLISGSQQSVRASPDVVETAIRTLSQNYIDAWNRADAEGIASQFVADGDLVAPDGTRASGQAAIRAFYAAAFQRGYGGSRAGIGIVALRAVGRAVVIVDGTWFIENARTPAGAAAPREEGVATLVAVKTPGGWRVSAVREQTSATTIHDMQAP